MKRWTLADGTAVALRDIGPDDAPLVQRFVHGLSDASRRRRFFTAVRQLSDRQLGRLMRAVRVDDLNIGVIAGDEMVALAQCLETQPGAAEFGMVVADAWQRRGLGARLLSLMCEHARRSGFLTLRADVLADNWPMLVLASRLGFQVAEQEDDDVLEVRLDPSSNRRHFASPTLHVGDTVVMRSDP